MRAMTPEERAKGPPAAALARRARAEARQMRRAAELALLDKLLAEAAMPERHRHE